MKSLKLLFVTLVSGTLLGCSFTPSMYQPYPDQMTPVRQQVAQNQADAAFQSLQVGISSDDWQLYSLEAGRIEQLQQDFPDSMGYYDKVIGVTETNFLSGKNQEPDFNDMLAEVITNSNAAPYVLQPYQIIMLYQNQAINYLAHQDLQDALSAFKQEKNMEEIFNIYYLQGVAKAEASVSLMPLYPKYATLVANTYVPTSVNNSLQNSLIDLIGSFAFYDSGDRATALSEIESAIQHSSPNNMVLSNERAYLQEPADHHVDSQVWVMLEESFVPMLQQKEYPVTQINPYSAATGDGSFQSFLVLPIYAGAGPAPGNWTLHEGSNSVILKPYLNIADLAAASLIEHYPLLATNAQAATEAKLNTQNFDEQQATIIPANASIYQADFQDQQTDDGLEADLRSWVTLPANIQLAEINLAPGTHSLTLQQAGQTTIVTCPVKVTKGSIALLWVNAQVQTPFCLQLL